MNIQRTGTVRVIGVGAPLAGDDGLGWAVIDALAARRLPGVELLRVRDPSALVELLEGRVVIVDALLSPEAPGAVRTLGEADLAAISASRFSSHGIGVAEAVALARTLGRAGEVAFVTVGIAEATKGCAGLSPPILRAVPRAADAVVAWLERAGAPP